MLNVRDSGECLGAEYFSINWHDTPGEASQAVSVAYLLNDGPARLNEATRFIREEDHRDGHIFRGDTRDPLGGEFAHQKGAWDLGEDAGAVTSLGIGIEGASVHDVAHGADPEFEDAVAWRAVNLGHEPDAARIVLIGRVVHANWSRHQMVRWEKALPVASGR